MTGINGTVTEPTLEELKAQLGAAIASGDDPAFLALVGKINKFKQDIAKAAAEVARKEAEALAGVREKLSVAIYKAVKTLQLGTDLAAVKAQGFTYHLDAPDKDGILVTYKSVGLLVPSVRKSSGGTTGGGKSKDEYGMSLGEIFDKFATAEDKANLEAASSNSKQWQVKVAVKKEAIKAGLLQPVK